MSNAVFKSIHQILGNIVPTFIISTQTYVDKNYQWTCISAAAEFAIHSTTNRQKCYSMCQLIFGCDIILAIKNRVNW